jgi:hypothetical protein
VVRRCAWPRPWQPWQRPWQRVPCRGVGGPYSCDGRWIRVARLPFLQLSNSKTITRMQRYLRLPISTLFGVVGRKSLGKAEAIVDPLGDVYLSGYKAPEDDEWRQLHNAVCGNISSFASQAYVSNTLEGGKGKQKGSKKRPGDIRLKADSGTHGWVAVGNRETWCDVTIKSAVCVTYAPLDAAARGGCAADGAQEKMRKYRDDIPDTAHFLPLPMESVRAKASSATPSNNCSSASRTSALPAAKPAPTMPGAGTATGLTTWP